MAGKLEDWFGVRRWRVLVEADGAGVVPAADGSAPILVGFRKGRFALEPPLAFLSPLGNAGRSGVVLQEITADGSDITGSLCAFGEAVVKRAAEEYHAIA